MFLTQIPLYDDNSIHAPQTYIIALSLHDHFYDVAPTGTQRRLEFSLFCYLSRFLFIIYFAVSYIQFLHQIVHTVFSS